MKRERESEQERKEGRERNTSVFVCIHSQSHLKFLTSINAFSLIHTQSNTHLQYLFVCMFVSMSVYHLKFHLCVSDTYTNYIYVCVCLSPLFSSVSLLLVPRVGRVHGLARLFLNGLFWIKPTPAPLRSSLVPESRGRTVIHRPCKTSRAIPLQIYAKGPVCVKNNSNT